MNVRPSLGFENSAWNGVVYYALVSQAKNIIQLIVNLDYNIKLVHYDKSSCLEKVYYQLIVALLDGNEEETNLRIGQVEGYLTNLGERTTI